MRFAFTLLAGFLGVSLIGVAQQTASPTRVKPSNEFKVKTQSEDTMRSSAPPLRATGPASIKNLESIERRTPTGSATRSSKKMPASVLPPEPEKPNQRIKFGANGGAKNSGLVRQSANPLVGRLRGRGAQ